MEYDIRLDPHEGEFDEDTGTGKAWFKGTLGVVIVAAAIFIVGPAQAHDTKANRCAAEDEIKVPWDYTNGKYRCVHQDEYVAEVIENSYRNPAVSRTVRGSVCEHPRWWERNHGITVMPEACDG